MDAETADRMFDELESWLLDQALIKDFFALESLTPRAKVDAASIIREVVLDMEHARIAAGRKAKAKDLDAE
jgi:hypothetical protein